MLIIVGIECYLKDKTPYIIRKARDTEWDKVTELAFRVFLKFEAKEYGQAGIDSFAEFLSSTMLEKLFHNGRYIVYVAVIEGEIIGIASLRSGNHLSLLFVDERYHRQGVASKLISQLQDYLLQNTSYSSLTVNAAPYGTPFYEAMGFVTTGNRTVTDGIIYTPMEMFL